MKGTNISVNVDLLTEFDILTFQPVLLNCMFTSVSINGNPKKKSVHNKRGGKPS